MKLRRIYGKHFEISWKPSKDSPTKREGLTSSVDLDEGSSSLTAFDADEDFLQHHASKLYDIAGKKLAKDDYTNF